MYVIVWFFLFFKQKTAYEMRISDCSSDVCSSDLPDIAILIPQDGADLTAPEIDYCTRHGASSPQLHSSPASPSEDLRTLCRALPVSDRGSSGLSLASGMTSRRRSSIRSEERTSELQSLMRISYAVFCLKKKNNNNKQNNTRTHPTQQ